MTTDSSPHIGKRILIPLLREYYLFEYFRHLIPRLLEDGFRVTIVTFDPRVKTSYSSSHPHFSLREGPVHVRVCWNRSGSLLFRTLLWAFGWPWAWWITRRQDFVVVPWDNKPLWYMISRFRPALTCHNVTDFLDLDMTIGHLGIKPATAQSRWHGIALALDRLLGGRLLPRVQGRMLQYWKHLFIDRLMGFRSPTTLHAFSGIDYFTVMGRRILENYNACGVGVGDSPTRIVVTGSPSFETVFTTAKAFGPVEREAMRRQLGLPADKKIFTFFLSPSSFTDAQIDEVAVAVESIHRKVVNAFFTIKFHPKTLPTEPERFRRQLQAMGGDLLMLTEFGGDEFNTRLILLSHCVVQKQSGVGYIAMMLQVPVISYNLVETDYQDDMYKLIGGSFHVETVGDMEAALDRLDTTEGREDLARKQEEACRKYCAVVESPCSEISRVIQRHFVEHSARECPDLADEERANRVRP